MERLGFGKKWSKFKYQQDLLERQIGLWHLMYIVEELEGAG